MSYSRSLDEACYAPSINSGSHTGFPRLDQLRLFINCGCCLQGHAFDAHNVNFTMGGYRASEQSQSAGPRYGVSARPDGELDEDAFGVGLHGLGGNLQLLGDAFVGKPAAHRAQDDAFART